MSNYTAYAKDGTDFVPVGPGHAVHKYTTAASAAKNWYRIANASTSQIDVAKPLHVQFFLTAYNTSQNADYYERWLVEIEVFGRHAHLHTVGSSAVPFSQVRVLYENTLASVSASGRPAIDIYLNYVVASACTVEIEEVFNSGWTFLADGQLAASSVPSGYENRAMGVYANGLVYCNTADYSNYSKINYTNISANTALAVNDTYAKKVLNCTGTITLTIPTGNANTAWFWIKNNGTGVVTLHPATTSVYFDNISDDIFLQPKEYILLACQSNGHYSIVNDGRWSAKESNASRTTQTFSSIVNAGTEITVPSHIVRGGKLLVVLNGVVCEEGLLNQYVDKTSTTIVFNFNLSAGDIVTAVSL